VTRVAGYSLSNRTIRRATIIVGGLAMVAVLALVGVVVS
jgi:hypothetical protein